MDSEGLTSLVAAAGAFRRAGPTPSPARGPGTDGASHGASDSDRPSHMPRRGSAWQPGRLRAWARRLQVGYSLQVVASSAGCSAQDRDLPQPGAATVPGRRRPRRRVTVTVTVVTIMVAA